MHAGRIPCEPTVSRTFSLSASARTGAVPRNCSSGIAALARSAQSPGSPGNISPQLFRRKADECNTRCDDRFAAVYFLVGQRGYEAVGGDIFPENRTLSGSREGLRSRSNSCADSAGSSGSGKRKVRLTVGSQGILRRRMFFAMALFSLARH